MTMTIQLSPEQAAVLAREASRRGVSNEVLAAEWLTRRLSELTPQDEQWTGARAIAYWEEQGLPALFPGADDSPAIARQLRSRAERKEI